MIISPSKKLFAHGGVYGISRVANRSIAFILIPLYAHHLGPDGYGVIQIMGMVAAVLGLIFLQGLHGAWYRLRFDLTTSKQVRCFETTIQWYLGLSIVVGLGVLSLFGEPLARLITPGIPYYPMGLLTALTAGATVFVLLYERKLQAAQRPVAFAVFSAIRTALTLGAIVWFVAGLDRGARGKIEAGALSMAVLAVASLVLLGPGSPRMVSGASLRRSLSYGLPLVPHNLAGLTNNLIDRLLVNAKLGLGLTGVYAMGYQIAGLGLVLAMAMNQAFTPLFIRSVKDAEEARERGDESAAASALVALAQSALVMVAAIGCVMLCITAAGREVLVLLTTEEFADSWRIIAPVAAGIVAWSCYAVFTQSITYNVKRVRLLSIITVLAAFVNIAANLVLIPRIGIMGAAWATPISNTVMAALAVVFGQAATPLPYRWRRWAMVLCCCVVGLAGMWVLDSRVDGLLLRVLLKAVCGIVAVCVVARSAGVTPGVLGRLWQSRGNMTC